MKIYIELIRYADYKKVLRAMKIFIILFFSSIIAVSANTYAQQTKLSLELNQVTVKEVIENIESQSEYVFFYKDTRIDLERELDINVEDKTIIEVLDLLFEGTNHVYKIDDRQVMIGIKETKQYKPDIEKETKQQQPQKKTITGKVIDNAGLPLPGVSIVVKGTTIGITTDIKGNYSLEIPVDAQTLVFSFVGMKSQEIVIGSQTQIDVIIEEETVGLEEVVAIGYGTQTKADITGAVSTVKSDKLTVAPQASTVNTLVGNVPGLVSKQENGEPGRDAAAINIRGYGAALIIVDGVERSFNNLDANSIESVTVLKDAAAAIYGARAGNGVILVTTKRGKLGKPQLQFNSSYTLQGFANSPNTFSSGQYAELFVEAQKNDGVPEAERRWTPEEIQKFYDGTDPRYPNTDWFDEVVRDWSPLQQNNISVQGGNDRVKYYAMLGTLSQEGFAKTGDHVYKRYNVMSNIDAKITDDLTATLNLSNIFSTNNMPFRNVLVGPAGNEHHSILFQDIFVTLPTYPTSYPDPTKIPFTNTAYSPLASMDQDIAGYRRQKTAEVNVSGSLEYAIPFVKGLKVKVFMNYKYGNSQGKVFQNNYIAYHYDYDTDVYTPVKKGLPTKLTHTVYNNSVLTNQFSLNYKKTVKNHKIGADFIYETIDIKGDDLVGSRQNYLTNTIDYLKAGGTDNQFITGGGSEFGRVGYVGRLNYNYADKYLLTVTSRYDASPKFAPENRWGFFPSVSAAWRVSEESFLKDNNILHNLKLRTSYSKSGYDATGNFQYVSAYQLSNLGAILGSPIMGVASTGIANPTISWEDMTAANMGVDFALFNSKLYGVFDVFSRKREGILAKKIGTTPNTFGAQLPAENLNAQRTEGFELMLGTQNRVGEFKYSVEGNISKTSTVWDYFDEPEYTDVDEIRLNTKTGKKVGQLIGWRTDGLFTSQEEIDNYPLDQDNRGNATIRPGDIKYIDISGPDGVPDGKLNWRDREVIGRSAWPEIFFGLSSQLQYKNFDMNFLLQGATLSTFQINNERYTHQWGTKVAYDGRWTSENNDANARWPRRTFNRSNSLKISDFWTVNGSYLRLKTASFGYTIPANILKKTGIEKIRLSVSGTNLFTFDNVSKYSIDPESRSGGGGFYYPIQRTISFGLNLNF